MANNVYVLEWYGPFHSPAKVREWENKEICCRKTYLYLFSGKKKHAREKVALYCGQAYGQTAGHRLGNKGHHIQEVIGRQEELEIWVATFSNKKPCKYDVNLVEKVLTSVLDQVVKSDTDEVLNETNKLRPRDNAYVINEWYFPNGKERVKYPANSMCSRIPDVLACYPNEEERVSYVWGSQRMRFIEKLQ